MMALICLLVFIYGGRMRWRGGCARRGVDVGQGPFGWGSWATWIHSVGWTLRSSPRTTFACSPPVNTLILFSPMCSLLLPWQASPTGNDGSQAANPVVSRPGRLPGYAPMRSQSRCRWAWGWRLLAIICLHCFPRLVSLGKTGTNFGTSGFRRFVPNLEVWY